MMAKEKEKPFRNLALSHQAHQLNNLLATVKLYTQLALRNKQLPPDLRENLESNMELLAQSKELIWDMQQREKSLFKRFSILEEGFYCVSLDGHMLDYNESFLRILGYKASDNLKGRQLTYLWNMPEQLKEFRDRLTEEEFLTDMQVTLNKADGKKIIINTNAFLLKNGNGREDAIIGTIRDATREKQAVASLEISESRFKKFIEHAPDIVTVIDGEGIIKFVNKTEFGYTPDDLIGQPIYNMIAPEHHEEVRKLIEKTIETGEANTYENSYYLEGEYYWYESRINLVSSTGGYAEVIIFSTNITQKKRSETQSNYSNKLMGLLLGNLPGMAYRCMNAPGWPMTYVSEGCYQLTGYHPEELTKGEGIQYEDLIHPQDRELVDEFVQEAVEKGKHFTIEYRIITRSGQEKWVWERGQKVNLPQSSEIYLEGFIMDITSMVTAQEALKESEEKYAVAFSSSPNAMSITRMADGYILDVNNAFEEITGYTLENIRGNSTIALHIWNDPENRKEVVNDLKNNVKISNRDYLFRREDGTVRKGVYSADLITIRNEPYILSSFFDVTEKAELETELQETQEKLLSIFRIAPSAIGLVKKRVILELNDRIFEMTGYKPDELIGKSSRILYPTKEEFDYVGKEKYDQIKSKGVGIVESRWKRKDGSVIDIILASTPLIQGDPSRGVIFTAIDITEQKMAEKEKQRLSAQLEQVKKLETVGRIAGGVAHEFNNTLQIINTYAELAAFKLGKDNEISNYLKQIINSTKQSSGMITQLLTFARKQAVVTEMLDINQVIDGMIDMLQNIVGERIRLIWKPGPDIWKVKLDPVQINQVLVNLAMNSRDAIPDEGRIVIRTVNLTLKRHKKLNLEEAEPGDYVSVSVTDNGIGMDKETIANIFEPFFTTKEKDKGTGLGLSTVYGVLRQSNGYINVKSNLEKGTTFELFFPRYKKT